MWHEEVSNDNVLTLTTLRRYKVHASSIKLRVRIELVKKTQVKLNSKAVLYPVVVASIRPIWLIKMNIFLCGSSLSLNELNVNSM